MFGNKKEPAKSRFQWVEEYGSLGQWQMILCDRITGVQYLFVQYAEGSGLTPLLDKDGKPLLAKLL